MLMLLALFLAAQQAAPRAFPQGGSLIETIAGGESSATPAEDFSPLPVSGLATDFPGNIYFSIQAKSQVFRLSTDGQVTVFAGTGVRQRCANGVPAAKSPLLNPRSLAVNGAGDVYIVCDTGLVLVDKATGILSTVFETPYVLQTGSAPAVGEIGQMVFGPDGNLYFSDFKDWRIKSYSFATRAVAVLAGNGTLGATQVGVNALSTAIRYPESVAVAADGTVYFSTLEPRVYRIVPEDGKLQAISIALPEEKIEPGEYEIPSSIALDGQGHLLVAQANRARILQIALADGAVTVYAGTGLQGFNGDGIAANRATLVGPSSIVSAPSGKLIIADNRRIRSVDARTGLISTRAGNAGAIVDDPDTMAFHAKLWEPAYAVAGLDGSVYITSALTNRLMLRKPNGDLIAAAGGGNYARIGSGPGLAAQVALFQPQGIWVDGENNVFFSDSDNRIIRHLDAASGWVTNFAVTPKNYNSAGLFLYYAGALVADGTYFYLSDPNGRCVWRISRKDASAEVYVGKGPDANGPSNDDSPAHLTAPAGLSLDAGGNLYIADGALGGRNGRILRVAGRDGSVTTVLSGLRQPSGLGFRSRDMLCFSEAAGNQISCLDMKRQTIRTVSGTGVAGFGGDGGPAECAQLNRPSGISFDLKGNLYIADTGNQRVRKVKIGAKPEQCTPLPEAVSPPLAGRAGDRQ